MDGESETFVTHALRADGFDASEDGTGRGTPLVPVLAQTITADMYRSGGAVAGNNDQGVRNCFVVPIQAGARTGSSTTDPRAGIGISEDGDPMYTLQSGKQHAIAFDTTQITSAANYSNPKAGDPCHPLVSGAHPPAVAFQSSQSGVRQVDCHATLDGNNGSRRHNGVIQQMAARRLTPAECEALQGFPRDYTLIPYRGKLAADGPRYKALGNSWAVPCVRWIFERMERVDNLLELSEASA